jgi:hypothetical protein
LVFGTWAVSTFAVQKIIFETPTSCPIANTNVSTWTTWSCWNQNVYKAETETIHIGLSRWFQNIWDMKSNKNLKTTKILLGELKSWWVS